MGGGIRGRDRITAVGRGNRPDRRDGYSLVQLARIDAARGDRDRCTARVERAHREVELRGVGCLAVYNAAALGLCALGSGDFKTAVDHLERAWMVARAEGLDNPNVVPFSGDLAEALARVGEVARASEILAWLEERAEATGLRYPRAAAARGRAVIEEDPSAAREWFARALSACEARRCPSSGPGPCCARASRCEERASLPPPANRCAMRS